MRRLSTGVTPDAVLKRVNLLICYLAVSTHERITLDRYHFDAILYHQLKSW
jgi:hypothetical protein